MMNKPIQRGLFLPKPVVVTLALALTSLLGVANYVVRHEISISAFYLLPICWACWVAGRRAGILVATVAAVIWFIADLMTAYEFGHRADPFWNALMLLTLFLVVVYLLSEFQTAHYHLEETVQRRTAALQVEIAERKRLEIAKLQAERLAVAGTMAAGVAHEVRNPLSSITLNLDLIQKENNRLAEASHHSPEEGRLLVNEIRAEVHRIQHVIEDYLQFARLPRAQRQPMALTELLEQKLAFMHGTFEQANVKLRTDFDPALTTIHADAEQLWQAVLNLIRNSQEAMPEGGTLTVSTRRDGAQALLRITDTGKGMNEEQRRQVFVPFFTTKAQGTGLGLSIVQQIVIEHGGHVECESAPGKGSTFTIILPLAKNS